MPQRILLSLLLLLAALQGCDASAPCDADQTFEGSVCMDEPTAAGASGASGASGAVDSGGVAVDAGTDASGSVDTVDAATGCMQALDEALGLPCSAPDACGCAAPYCAVTPGQTEGYCTTQGCDPAASDCPSGYQCFDLSSVGVTGVPTFCVRQ